MRVHTQAELNAVRERLEAQSAELAAARLEATEAHDTLAVTNERLAGYQQRDADVSMRA
jgi:hypothetical protein